MSQTAGRGHPRRPGAVALYRRFAHTANPAPRAANLRVDLDEDDHEYRIEVDVPGIRLTWPRRASRTNDFPKIR